MKVCVNVHEAKTQLSKLIVRALAGDTVIIANAGKPVVRLVPEPPAGKREFGSARGSVVIHDEAWHKPMNDDEYKEFLGE